MILTPQQIKALQDLKIEMGECIMMTAPYEWDSIKDKPCGLTFEMILDWLTTVNSIFPGDRN